MVFVIQDAIRENLTLWTAAKLIPFALPGSLIFSIPGTILFSICIVYGRLAGANEFIAIKSLGISPWVAIRPAIIFSLALSFVTVFLGDVAVPWGKAGLYRIVLHSVHHTIYGALRTEREYHKGPISIRVQDVAGDSLIQPIFEIGGDLRLESVTAQLICNAAKNQLILVADNGSIVSDKITMRFTKQHREVFDLGKMIKKRASGVSPSSLSMKGIQNEIGIQKGIVEDLSRKYENALQIDGGNSSVDVLPISTGSVDIKEGQLEKNSHVKGIKTQLDSAIARYHKLRLEGPRRWATGFSCLCFALVGASVAIRLRFTDFWTSFILCFVPILVVYYPILAFTADAVKSGKWFPETIWTANIVIFGAGVWLFRGVFKN